jgi:hypothetical protein
MITRSLSRPRSSRRAIALAGLAVGGVLLVGCSAPQAGSAATLGETRISESALTQEVQEVLLAKQQPVDSGTAELMDKTLGRMITAELVNKLAIQNGIVVTQGDIDEQLSSYDSQVGGRDEVIKVFAEQDVAPSQIESIVRMNLQAQALGVKLDPHGSADTQGQAVFDAVNKLSHELGVESSPRYGTWEPASLAITPGPDDLTAPPAGTQ